MYISITALHVRWKGRKFCILNGTNVFVIYSTYIALGLWRTQDVGLNEELQDLLELLFATNKINPHQSSLSVQVYLRLLCNSLPTRLECVGVCSGEGFNENN